MRTTVSILTLGLILAGCMWTPWKKPDDRPILPHGQFATSMSAGALPRGDSASPTTSAPTSQPLVGAPSTKPVVIGAETVEAVMIQVNGKFITLQQLIRPIRRELEAAAAGATEMQFRARAQGLIWAQGRSRIEHTLLLAEAKKRLLDWEKDNIEAEITRQYRRLLAEANGSQAILAERLGQRDTDIAGWKKQLRDRLMIQSHLQRRLFSEIHVTRQEMLRYYEAHGQEFRSCGRVQMQIISVPWTAFLSEGEQASTQARRPAAREKARQQIDAAAAALAKGDDFAEVARKFSRGPMASAGGGWPMMDLGSFRATLIEQAAYDQEAGRVSKPIEASDGFYIVKTLARRLGEQLPFEKVQDHIESKLTEQQYEQLGLEYLAELRDKATIVVAENFHELSAQAAVNLFYRRRR